MRSFCLKELEAPLAGRVLGADVSFDAVSTDTRTLQPGELFVALRGPTYDGHGFVEQAAASGAAAALVEDAGEFPVSSLAVADTRQALGRLAALNRACFEGKLVGITGSSGKTTVKNMLAQVLQAQAPTLATQGNLNNEIGVPLTLLRLGPEHRFAVIEMGASRAGDIRYLCELAAPDVSVLLNAMPAHLEGFGDLAGVASAKGEIFSGLAQNGIAVINADSEFAPLWRQLCGSRRSLEFGLGEKSAVSAREVVDRGIFGTRFTLLGEQAQAQVELSLPGQHNVVNALAASAAALVLGVPLGEIAASLSAVRAEPGRMQVTRTGTGAVVVDDSYNANPGSVEAAIDLLASCEGRRILVLGTMAELGPDSERLHEAVGHYAAVCGIEELWLSGTDTVAAGRGYGDVARYYEQRSDLARELADHCTEGDVILVKGSRSAGMESIVTALLEQGGGVN